MRQRLGTYLGIASVSLAMLVFAIPAPAEETVTLDVDLVDIETSTPSPAVPEVDTTEPVLSLVPSIQERCVTKKSPADCEKRLIEDVALRAEIGSFKANLQTLKPDPERVAARARGWAEVGAAAADLEDAFQAMSASIAAFSLDPAKVQSDCIGDEEWSELDRKSREMWREECPAPADDPDIPARCFKEATPSESTSGVCYPMPETDLAAHVLGLFLRGEATSASSSSGTDRGAAWSEDLERRIEALYGLEPVAQVEEEKTAGMWGMTNRSGYLVAEAKGATLSAYKEAGNGMYQALGGTWLSLAIWGPPHAEMEAKPDAIECIDEDMRAVICAVAADSLIKRNSLPIDYRPFLTPGGKTREEIIEAGTIATGQLSGCPQPQFTASQNMFDDRCSAMEGARLTISDSRKALVDLDINQALKGVFDGILSEAQLAADEIRVIADCEGKPGYSLVEGDDERGGQCELEE